MRLGLIQSRGLGDIVIAAPIAQFYIDHGHEVFWPVDDNFFTAVKEAFPEIGFLPLDPELSHSSSRDYFLDRPVALLKDLQCDPIVALYSYLSDLPVVNEGLASALKFDEYKYALCDVPFSEKWRLRLSRNLERESRLFLSLDVREPFVLVHNKGSDGTYDLPIKSSTQVKTLYVDERTNNPFDWLGTIERAAEVHLIDSVFANIVEQLALHKRAFLYLRSQIRFTPVFKNLAIRVR